MQNIKKRQDSQFTGKAGDGGTVKTRFKCIKIEPLQINSLPRESPLHPLGKDIAAGGTGLTVLGVEMDTTLV
jgi:hypothetical protein